VRTTSIEVVLCLLAVMLFTPVPYTFSLGEAMNYLWGQYTPCGIGWSWGRCTSHPSQEIHPSRTFTLNLEINFVLTFLLTLLIWRRKKINTNCQVTFVTGHMKSSVNPYFV